MTGNSIGDAGLKIKIQTTAKVRGNFEMGGCGLDVTGFDDTSSWDLRKYRVKHCVLEKTKSQPSNIFGLRI